MATYWSIAEEDEDSARDDHARERFRTSVYFAQQAGEKYLKHILQQLEPEHKFLKSHQLENILVAIDPVHKVGDMQDAALYLTSFYFNTRYPGDNYTVIDKVQSAYALKRLDLIKGFCKEKQAQIERAIS